MTTSERLQTLRELSKPLETPSAVRTEHLLKAGQHVDGYLESLAERSVYEAPGPAAEAHAAFSIQEDTSSIESALDAIGRYVDGAGQHLGSSRFFAYVPSGCLHEAAVADYIGAGVNRYTGVGAATPGAARMEETLLRWLANVVGYPESAEGDITSGASMATLSAIVAARESHGLKASDFASAVVYATPHTHHTFRKALHVAGVGECVLRHVAVDDGLRMDAEALRRQVREDIESGYSPWFVAATAGTTDTGAVDPLEAISDVATEFGLWLHVDAAYGGAFAICDAGKKRLAGLERSDSLVLDPHKGFFLPCGVGVLLVRDGKKLYDAYHARGIYMQDVAHDTERSPCDYSAELTRPFRALRFWLPFKIHGSRAFAAALEEKLLLARYFYDEVAAIPGIEVGQSPDLSIVAFRARSKTGDNEETTRALFDAIRRDGRVYLTSTRVDGRMTIRMAILTYNTHIEDVELALQVIRECVA